MHTQVNITLYAAKMCPWSHRVDLALAESGLDYQRFEIDLMSKPTWYTSQINAASKVPAIAFGGPDVDPATPSSESTKLTESAVLLEFIADLSAGTPTALLPADPIERAKARFFIETIVSKVIGAFDASIVRGEDPAAKILPAIDALMEVLPADGGYVLGSQWSMADIAVAPHLARTLLLLENDLGVYDEGLGKSVWDTLQTETKYARFRQYWEDVSNRDAWKRTWHEVTALQQFSNILQPMRAARRAKASGWWEYFTNVFGW